jgi:hypothetical protein
MTMAETKPDSNDRAAPKTNQVPLSVNPFPPFYPEGGAPSREVAGERAIKQNADADALLNELTEKNESK